MKTEQREDEIKTNAEEEKKSRLKTSIDDLYNRYQKIACSYLKSGFSFYSIPSHNVDLIPQCYLEPAASRYLRAIQKSKTLFDLRKTHELLATDELPKQQIGPLRYLRPFIGQHTRDAFLERALGMQYPRAVSMINASVLVCEALEKEALLLEREVNILKALANWTRDEPILDGTQPLSEERDVEALKGWKDMAESFVNQRFVSEGSRGG